MGPSAKKLSVPGTEKNLSGHDWASPPTGPQDKPSQRLPLQNLEKDDEQKGGLSSSCVGVIFAVGF